MNVDHDSPDWPSVPALRARPAPMDSGLDAGPSSSARKPRGGAPRPFLKRGEGVEKRCVMSEARAQLRASWIQDLVHACRVFAPSQRPIKRVLDEEGTKEDDDVKGRGRGNDQSATWSTGAAGPREGARKLGAADGVAQPVSGRSRPPLASSPSRYSNAEGWDGELVAETTLLEASEQQCVSRCCMHVTRLRCLSQQCRPRHELTRPLMLLQVSPVLP